MIAYRWVSAFSLIFLLAACGGEDERRLTSAWKGFGQFLRSEFKDGTEAAMYAGKVENKAFILQRTQARTNPFLPTSIIVAEPSPCVFRFELKEDARTIRVVSFDANKLYLKVIKVGFKGSAITAFINGASGPRWLEIPGTAGAVTESSGKNQDKIIIDDRPVSESDSVLAALKPIADLCKGL